MKNFSPSPSGSKRFYGITGALTRDHKKLAQKILLRPGRIRQGKLAVEFGWSRRWVSAVMCSPVFQAYLEQRRREVLNPLIRAAYDRKLAEVLAARDVPKPPRRSAAVARTSQGDGSTRRTP